MEERSCLPKLYLTLSHDKTDMCVLARVSFTKALLPARFSKSQDRKIITTFIKFNCSPCTYSMSLVNILRSLVWSFKKHKIYIKIWFLPRVENFRTITCTLSIRLHYILNYYSKLKEVVHYKDYVSRKTISYH